MNTKVLVDFDPKREINTVITPETAHAFVKKLFALKPGKMIHISVQELTPDELSDIQCTNRELFISQ